MFKGRCALSMGSTQGLGYAFAERLARPKAATSTALIGFTRAIALETARTNIICNAICPATVPTPNIEGRLEAERAKSGQSRAEPEQAFLASRQPSGKFVAPERVAAMVALLGGPSGADITGSAIPMDGGWSAG